MLQDGSINPGEMTSFNHYALGAVADWLHRVVAGLAPGSPGYHELVIAPRPLPGLDWARTRHETPYGTAEVEWRRHGDEITIAAVVPANSRARVELPDAEPFTVGAGRHQWTFRVAAREPAHGAVTTATSLADIMDDPEAYQAVMAAFTRISPDVADEFRRRTAWVPNQPLFGAFSLISPDVADEVEQSLAALSASREG